MPGLAAGAVRRLRGRWGRGSRRGREGGGDLFGRHGAELAEPAMAASLVSLTWWSPRRKATTGRVLPTA